MFPNKSMQQLFIQAAAWTRIKAVQTASMMVDNRTSEVKKQIIFAYKHDKTAEVLLKKVFKLFSKYYRCPPEKIEIAKSTGVSLSPKTIKKLIHSSFNPDITSITSARAHVPSLMRCLG